MTREEAIKRMRAQQALCCVGCMHPQEIGYCENTCKLPEAYGMAIEALQAQPTNGRLIDADALSKKLCETTIFVKDGEVFQRMINDAPTVQADRPHGEWVEVVERTEQYDREGVKTWATLYQCSNCGFVLNAIEGHIGQYHFCPACGCVMDMRGGK